MAATTMKLSQSISDAVRECVRQYLTELGPANVSAMVREFHETFGAPVADEPTLIPAEDARLRWSLMAEEVEELHDATFTDDLVGIADALGDIVYIAFGTALAYGIDLEAVLKEIHRSNMLKVQPDGTVAYREDGKVLKPEGWEPPNLLPILGMDS